MSSKPKPRTMATGPKRAQERAEMYRHFIPEWPALAESFEREVAAHKAKQQKAPHDHSRS